MRSRSEKTDPSRRIFIKVGAISLGLSALASASAAIDFLSPKVLYEPSRLLRLRRLEEYPDQDIVFDADNRLFIVRRPEGTAVLSAVCTHLGCTVGHDSETQSFRCPCHGSVFEPNGQVSSGPAPVALSWFFADLGKDGRLQVHTDRSVASEFVLRVNG
jgi:cytochrome b6-f complex iron-sulfur subunit